MSVAAKKLSAFILSSFLPVGNAASRDESFTTSTLIIFFILFNPQRLAGTSETAGTSCSWAFTAASIKNMGDKKE